MINKKFILLKKKYLILFLSLFSFTIAMAQLRNDTVSAVFKGDSVGQKKNLHLQSDTLISTNKTILTEKTLIAPIKDSVYVCFKPNPERVLWLGAIIPGFGQIANKKYWKLPFVYGGFMGFAYAITWNNRQYQTYKNAYRDSDDGDPTTNSHIDILPKGYTIETFPGGLSTYKARLKTQQDQFRQYRDLSIILSVVYYGLVLLDAYVDAELYDFDISPNLVMNITPTQIPLEIANNKSSSFGLQCSIKF
ncbi:MAG: hypothetical protein CR965_00480 [Paludibacter sp.]|nr:MAG: hypothetical protein CR965_00480 [Paludibacter sp.]